MKTAREYVQQLLFAWHTSGEAAHESAARIFAQCARDARAGGHAAGFREGVEAAAQKIEPGPHTCKGLGKCWTCERAYEERQRIRALLPPAEAAPTSLQAPCTVQGSTNSDANSGASARTSECVNCASGYYGPSPQHTTAECECLCYHGGSDGDCPYHDGPPKADPGAPGNAKDEPPEPECSRCHHLRVSHDIMGCGRGACPCTAPDGVPAYGQAPDGLEPSMEPLPRLSPEQVAAVVAWQGLHDPHTIMNILSSYGGAPVDAALALLRAFAPGSLSR